MYQITLPKDTDWKADQAISLARQLASCGNLILGISARMGAVVWQIIDLNENPEFGRQSIIGAVKAVYFNAEVSEPTPYQPPPFEGSYERASFIFNLGNIFPVPMIYAHDLPKVDPLSIFVNAASSVREGESVNYYLYLAEPNSDLSKIGIEYITHGHFRSGVSRADASTGTLGGDIIVMAFGGYWGLLTKGKREPKYQPSDMKMMEEKLRNGPLVQCLLALEVNTPMGERIAALAAPAALDEMGGEIQGLGEFPGGMENLTVTNDYLHYRSNTLNRLQYYRKSIGPKPLERDMVLCPQEIATLWHLPHKGFEAPEIVWQKGKQVAAPPAFRGTRDGVKLGTNKLTRNDIYQPVSERLVHTLIIGKTGTGKTSFMQALAQQDIEAGNGIAVIDPLGNLIRRIIQHGIPKERENDVVILDIGFELHEGEDPVRYPPPLNPLAKLQGVNARKSAGEFASILGKIYEDTGNTRWNQTIQAALELLTAEDHPTLYDLWKVIDEKPYRNHLLSKFDFNVRQKWQMLERGGALSDTSVQSALWRLNQFLDFDLVRASTCHPDKLDFFSLLRERRIILVSVHADEGLVPKNAQNVLGAIVLSHIHRAAMAGAVREPNTQPFMLYVDEVQDFVTSSLNDLARQARQKGLGLVVTTQDTFHHRP